MTMPETLSSDQIKIFDEAVTSLKNEVVNDQEIMDAAEVLNIFRQYENEFYIRAVSEDLKNVETQVSGFKRKIEEGTKKKAPIASKWCNVCNTTFQVPAPKKKCNTRDCIGILELVAKQEKVLKRLPPLCSKFCKCCNTSVENVPTATKKCKTCGETFSKV